MTTFRLPEITLTTEDYAVLSRYTDSNDEKRRPLLDFLAKEIERATVVPPTSIDPRTVTLGSIVKFQESSRGMVWQRRLRSPNASSLSQDDLPVLTHVGVALIGLRMGQKMFWQSLEGKTLELQVLDVPYQPEATSCGRSTRT